MRGPFVAAVILLCAACSRSGAPIEAPPETVGLSRIFLAEDARAGLRGFAAEGDEAFRLEVDSTATLTSLSFAHSLGELLIQPGVLTVSRGGAGRRIPRAVA